MRATHALLSTVSALMAGLMVSAASAQAPLTLNIIHTNDVHARVDEVTAQGSVCTPRDIERNACFGGYPRVASAIAEARRTLTNPLVLDAGDVFQGTLFYNRYKSAAIHPFLNLIAYDAMTLGNHEFDDGVAELDRFLSNLRVPVVTANIDVSREPRLQGRWQPHRVFDIGGQKVGVIGLTTQDTVITSSPGPTVAFTDHAEALRREVAALQAQGINKIIALTHVGIGEDRRLAQMVDGIDVYVGGHSHTLLHTGDDRRRQGAYPVVERTPSGAPVLVVQAFTASLFLGQLEVAFNADGVVERWSGNTRLLDASVPKDPAAQAIVDQLAPALAELRAQPVAPVAVALDGDRANCRQRECLLGSLIADAMLWGAQDTKAQIAIMNGGGVRTSIPQGMVTLGQVLEVLPFSNTLATFELDGAGVLAAMENGVSQAENMENPGTGRFPQVAGVRFAFDAAKPAGSRVLSVELRQADGSFKPLDRAATYSVVTNNFVRTGGDGYSVFRDQGKNAYDAGPNLEDVFAAYLRHLASRGPVSPTTDGRITRVN